MLAMYRFVNISYYTLGRSSCEMKAINLPPTQLYLADVLRELPESRTLALGPSSK